ncbi:PARP10_14_15 [Acanthosepion pharaonis]|uniref:PARP10_14_15 n=1 Tax=Acanthosepion pharaonis TaxID=158019 RepID=A0A812D9G6_ACAPH|nr:PARP10_14_15 [Sepia pharaonis]
MGDSLLVKVYQADILNVDVDGIVNAANKWLAHAGGVARAIINAAGDAVNIEGQRKRNGRALNDGEVLSTSAGNLTQYRNIIHAVGPINTPSSRNCEKKLEETVYNSLIEANQLGLCSVALPAISSGIFGVPLDICTNAYVMGVKEFYKTKPSDCQLKEIHFVDMNPVTCKAIKDDFAKQLSEVPAVTGNNIHQSKYNSANISSYEDMEVKAIDEKSLRCVACKKPLTGIIQGNHSPGTMSVKTDCLDPNNLRQVTACLADKKITPEDVAERNIKNHIVLY